MELTYGAEGHMGQRVEILDFSGVEILRHLPLATPCVLAGVASHM